MFVHRAVVDSKLHVITKLQKLQPLLKCFFLKLETLFSYIFLWFLQCIAALCTPAFSCVTVQMWWLSHFH